MTDAPKLDFAKPVSSRSHAWCGDCTFQAWGTWAHSKANGHHLMHGHLVHLTTPDTDEAKAERAAYLDRAEAQEREERERSG